MIKTILMAAAALVLSTDGAFASGFCPAKPPRAPKSGAIEAIDSAKYELGKAIFNGKTALPAANAKSAKKQSGRLAAAATSAGKAGANLPALAGRLSEDQLSALEYFVGKRYCR